ncbi:hypothetical protein H5410_009863 [Solanum commersonii]|uniref:Uncharacterized protein n=1 Tax=Solanum commersonii TaxID=4109 RepID=A0A9J6AJ48_SOLCO|nr:hypothetical protein H5410_009863 [Solanum commersonii]
MGGLAHIDNSSPSSLLENKKCILLGSNLLEIIEFLRVIFIDVEYVVKVPFGVAQWFGLGTSMLEVSSSKPLANKSKGWFGLGTSMLEVSSSKPLASKSKGFAFWVELVAPDLPSAGYLSYVSTSIGVVKGKTCYWVKIPRK